MQFTAPVAKDSRSIAHTEKGGSTIPELATAVAATAHEMVSDEVLVNTAPFRLAF